MGHPVYVISLRVYMIQNYGLQISKAITVKDLNARKEKLDQKMKLF